mmetsp:Transcript_27683/g.79899  ORF Transcript_27683/g.79899 Transcript_27683/m.79899 type:complete len:286 (+) Transcript_27683:1702-2559(+)
MMMSKTTSAAELDALPLERLAEVHVVVVVVVVVVILVVMVIVVMIMFVMVIMRMAEKTAPLLLVLGRVAGNLVLTSPGGRDERLVGGILGIDVLVLLLLDPEVLLVAGHGEAACFAGRFVGRKDGEGRLVGRRRQDDPAGIARLRRPVGGRDAAVGGEGVGHDEIDLVGMTGRGDAQAADADVLLVVLGLLGGAGEVGRLIDRDGPLVVVVEALSDALGLAVASGGETAGVVAAFVGIRRYGQKSDGQSGGAPERDELHDVVVRGGMCTVKILIGCAWNTQISKE